MILKSQRIELVTRSGHNQGLYLYKDRLAILSVQHQTIHMYKLGMDKGKLTKLYSVGRTVYDTDEYLLSCTGEVLSYIYTYVASTFNSKFNNRLLST